MKKHLLALALLTASQSQAAQLEVTIQNITGGNTFGEVVVSAHNDDIYLFREGQEASFELSSLSEFGQAVQFVYRVFVDQKGVAEFDSSLTRPGMSNTLTLDTMDYPYLSIGSMILPTNDGFTGLDSWPIPNVSGTYSLALNSYDAGTELNTERFVADNHRTADTIISCPSEDCGTGAVGIPDNKEANIVHPHPGIHGDFDPNGGYSDLNSAVHKWQDPVALITIKVAAENDTAKVWNPEQVSYIRGDIVSHMNNHYMVAQAHSSQSEWSPSETPALFNPIDFEENP